LGQVFCYVPFTQITGETDPAIDHIFGFTGRERDDESGLYFYRARYYDPAIGQFVSEDPIGFEAGDANLHRYVGNGPTNSVDPSGLTQTSYTVTPIGPRTNRHALARVIVPGGVFEISSKLTYRSKISAGNKDAGSTTIRTTVRFTPTQKGNRIKLAVLQNVAGILKRQAKHYEGITTERGWFIRSAALAFDKHVDSPEGGHSIFPGDYFPPDAANYPGLDMGLDRIRQWASNSDGMCPKGDSDTGQAWFEDYKTYLTGVVPGMTWTSRHYYVGAYDSTANKWLGFVRFSVVDSRIKHPGEVAARIDVFYLELAGAKCTHRGMPHMPSDFHVAIERFPNKAR
jgi:RHS repeat-associated protein